MCALNVILDEPLDESLDESSHPVELCWQANLSMEKALLADNTINTTNRATPTKKAIHFAAHIHAVFSFSDTSPVLSEGSHPYGMTVLKFVLSQNSFTVLQKW